MQNGVVIYAATGAIVAVVGVVAVVAFYTKAPPRQKWTVDRPTGPSDRWKVEDDEWVRRNRRRMRDIFDEVGVSAPSQSDRASTASTPTAYLPSSGSGIGSPVAIAPAPVGSWGRLRDAAQEFAEVLVRECLRPDAHLERTILGYLTIADGVAIEQTLPLVVQFARTPAGDESAAVRAAAAAVEAILAEAASDPQNRSAALARVAAEAVFAARRAGDRLWNVVLQTSAPASPGAGVYVRDFGEADIARAVIYGEGAMGEALHAAKDPGLLADALIARALFDEATAGAAVAHLLRARPPSAVPTAAPRSDAR